MIVLSLGVGTKLLVSVLVSASCTLPLGLSLSRSKHGHIVHSPSAQNQESRWVLVGVVFFPYPYYPVNENLGIYETSAFCYTATIPINRSGREGGCRSC
jgi:hypothetical protein